MTEEEILRYMSVDTSKIEKFICNYIERIEKDICNDYYRLTYSKPIYVRPVKVKSLKQRLNEAYYQKEDNEMKATSTEIFKDIIAIDLELQTFPNPDTQDKFIVSATNRDDIFCFVFEGQHIVDACRRVGLFTGWEKDQKIRELEKELGEWKREAADCLRLRDEVRREKNKEINKLKQQLQQAEDDRARLTDRYNLEKAANESLGEKIKEINKLKWQLQMAENDKRKYEWKIKEYNKNFDKLKEENDRLNKENVELIKENEKLEKQLQQAEDYKREALQSQHNLIVELNQKNHKLQEENEKLKKELHSLKTLKKSNLPETPITNTVLVDDYLKLTKENEKLIFEKAMLKEENEKLKKDANEQPSSTSRADILDQAKKCVCGQREQDYGTPESNFQLIADLWNGYLFPSLQENKAVISPTDVSMMMALMKIARIRNGGGSGDSFVDLAGYAACGGEIWHGQKAKDQN